MIAACGLLQALESEIRAACASDVNAFARIETLLDKLSSALPPTCYEATALTRLLHEALELLCREESLDSDALLVAMAQAAAAGPRILQGPYANERRALLHKAIAPLVQVLGWNQEKLDAILSNDTVDMDSASGTRTLLAKEMLDAICVAEGALLALESDPCDAEACATAARAFRTTREIAGAASAAEIRDLAFQAENLIEQARAGRFRLKGGFLDLTFVSCDTLRVMVQTMLRLQYGATAGVPGNYAALMRCLADPLGAGISEDETNVNPAGPRLGDIIVSQGFASREQIEEVVQQQKGVRVGEALVLAGVVSADVVAQALRLQRCTRRLPKSVLLPGKASAHSAVEATPG